MIHAHAEVVKNTKNAAVKIFRKIFLLTDFMYIIYVSKYSLILMRNTDNYLTKK